jgi:hypothetical protein
VPQEEDHVASVVRDVVLSELSWVVVQPREVISFDDHLVHTIHADADDLSFDFIPFVERALEVSIPVSSWREACTVGQVCDLVASHYRQKPAHERAAVEARLAMLCASLRNADDTRPRLSQTSYRCSPVARGPRLTRSWQAGARARRRALRSGPLFGPKPSPALAAAAEDADPVFVLVRDAVFWLLEAYLEQPRSTLPLEGDVAEPPYVRYFSLWESFGEEIVDMLEVHPSQREWSSISTVREICRILARHFKALPPDVRQTVEARLREWKVEDYNAPSPQRWWHVWRWQWPV